jgi:hypothetical protein
MQNRSLKVETHISLNEDEAPVTIYDASVAD